MKQDKKYDNMDSEVKKLSQGIEKKIRSEMI